MRLSADVVICLNCGATLQEEVINLDADEVKSFIVEQADGYEWGSGVTFELKEPIEFEVTFSVKNWLMVNALLFWSTAVRISEQMWALGLWNRRN